MLSVVLILSVFSGVPAEAFASEAVSRDEFTYEVLNGTYCAVTEYTGEEAEVTVPSEIDGYIVQEISSSAFADNTTVEKVMLPETVERIGTNIFKGCTKLTYVGFGSKMTTISGGMFSGCTSLAEIDIPAGITYIGSDAFSGCTSLAAVNFPETLKTINNDAFYGCTGLKGIQLPDSVTAISGRAFYNCKNLSEVKLPAGWTTVYVKSSYGYESPFQGCTKLTEITLPEGMTAVPDYAFQNCNWITKVGLSSSVTQIGYRSFAGCTGLTGMEFPAGLNMIGSEAFNGCMGLKGITLPEGLSVIGSGAFYDCTGLESITLPEGITKLNADVFGGCTGLKEVNLPETLTTIDYDAFYGCMGLESIRIPDGVTAISGRAFYNCKNLSEVTLPKGWTTVYVRSSYGYESPFQGCTKLKEITLPEGMMSVPDYAFQDCSSLTKVTFPSGVTQIGYRSFAGCTGLKEIALPEGLNSIGAGAFNGCTGLKGITLPEGITKLNADVFDSCTGLTEVNLPETLTTIDYDAFYGCTGLKSIRIPDGVTAISGRAFNNCKNLSEVTLPKGWTTVYVRSAYGYESPFQGCTKLTEVTLPEGMTAVPDYAFKDCTSLKQINFPEGMTRIRYSSFENCSGLNRLDLPDTVTYIESRAFYGCKGFRMLNFNEKLESIGSYAFSGCDGLVSLVLNEGLTNLSDYAFADCANLTAARVPKAVTSFGKDSFKNCSKLTIYCYSGSAAHKALENTSYKYKLLDEHEHVYETTIETEPTCTRGGSQIKTCTVCGYNYIELINALGHDYVSAKTEPTCTEKGYTTYTCRRCNDTYQDDYMDALGHTYGDWIVETEPTCTQPGSKYRICSVCNYKETAAIAAADHKYVSEVVEPTCTSQGYTIHTCSVCQNTYTDTYVNAKEHTYGDWIVDVAATVLAEGSQHRTCSACGNTETQSIERVKIDISSNDSYGLANFTVVNAQTLSPISGAQIFVSTEKDGENTFTTDAEGKVSIILPVGKQAVSVYASGCLTRNLKVNIASGENDIKPIGLSDKPAYNAEIKSELMTIEEIEAAGIDTTAPGNGHVYKYELTLEFEPEVDASSIISYFNENGDFLGGYSPDGVASPGDFGTGSGSGYYLQYQVTTEGGVKTATSGIQVKVKDEIITVYPVSEYFYIIVRGEVRWLKEMFDVEMLVINNSNTDTLEDLTATLELPEGLSLADMKGEQQSLSQKIDKIDEGKSESVHWYVRGDTAGSYNIQARLQGMVMPFEEEIDDIFVAKNQLQVWAGNALNLHFEFPNAAYYGVDYPITITLTNVSDITLYNVSHMVQIEQGMIIYYADGSKKEKIELSDWKVVGVKEFHPGDQIIIQASVNIFFQSERIQMELEKLIGIVDGIEQLVNAYKAIQTAIDATNALFNCVDGCSKSLDNFNFSAGGDKDKLELFKQLYGKISGLASSYSTSGNKTLDAAAALANSGLNVSLNAITNDPDKWLKEHSVSDIKALLNKISGLENAITSGSGTSSKFDIYDSIRTAISAIPIRFALKRVFMKEDEDNTTSIPWSYTVTDVSAQYFGVSSVSKYLSSLTQAAMGEIYEESVPWYMQLIPGLDDPLHREEAIKYIQATENEISKVKAKDATGKVTFKAWIERNSASDHALQKVTPFSDAGDVLLTCDNENATYENGVLEFTGDGTISILPKNQTGGILHIEDSVGNSYIYVIGIVKEHTCKPGEQQVIIPATEEYDGFAVKQCETCGDILEIIPLYYEQRCKEHTFTEWETESEATCVEAGIQKRSCTTCGAVEYQFTETGAHTFGEWEVTKEATCTEAGEKVRRCSRCDCSESEEIEATGHDYEGVVTEPTCTEAGYTTYTCKNCGDSYVTDEVEALGHDLGEWEVTKEATCTEAGEKVRRCSRCDYSESEEIEATGHNYVDGICTKCGQDDPDWADDDSYTLRYITVNGRTAWYYANEKGQVDTTYTGITTNGYGWWYVRNGEVDFSYTGLAQHEGVWWRIVNGQVDFNCTSVVNSEYGWWYVRNGQVDFTYIGIAPNENGWWRIVNGQVDFNCTSVVNSEYGWWYVRNGQIDFTYTGIASNENGWWRIVNGQVDFNCTSVVKNEYGWWYVKNGQIDFSYTGLASNEYGWWYIKSGMLDFSYNGYVNWYGAAYRVQNGQVVF